MATADESMSHSSLQVNTGMFVSHRVQGTITLCTHMSKVLDSETPSWPYVAIFSFKVLSNNGTRQISSTSRFYICPLPLFSCLLSLCLPTSKNQDRSVTRKTQRPGPGHLQGGIS